MGVLGVPNKNFSNLTIPLILLLIFFPSSKASFLDGLKNAWDTLVVGYPFTSTLQLTNRINGGPLTITCVLDEGIRKMATIKTGQTFSFDFQQRSPDRNNMMCFLLQRRKPLGWFFPFYYGIGQCKWVSSIWSKYRKLCIRQLYLKHAEGAARYNGKLERFNYRPIESKHWGYMFFPGLKPSQ